VTSDKSNPAPATADATVDQSTALRIHGKELLRRNPADFVRFRMAVEYPLPMVRGEVWLELPD
jgi:hypothetical protein